MYSKKYCLSKKCLQKIRKRGKLFRWEMDDPSWSCSILYLIYVWIVGSLKVSRLLDLLFTSFTFTIVTCMDLFISTFTKQKITYSQLHTFMVVWEWLSLTFVLDVSVFYLFKNKTSYFKITNFQTWYSKITIIVFTIAHVCGCLSMIIPLTHFKICRWGCDNNILCCKQIKLAILKSQIPDT